MTNEGFKRRPIMKKHTIIVLISFLIGISAISPSDASTIFPNKDTLTVKVDKLFTQWDKWDSPGAALAVVREGKIIYKRGYGSAQLEYNSPITPSTIFHVASVSKQFTAFSIAILANQGKLELDDDIHNYLPEVPDFGKTITIRHLIHHISGLRDQWELLAMAGWRLDDVITKEHILKMVHHQKDLNFDPGEEYLYCNTGYTLLAEIVSRVTGQSFREWTEANIFKPLGMSNTHFHDDHEMIVKNRAYSYRPLENGGFKKSVLSYANVGATSLFTTVEDLSRWIQNFEDARVGGKKVVDQMGSQGVLNSGREISYAFALSVGKHKGLRMIGHSGGDAGFRSYLMMFPEHKLGIAILSNLSSFNTSRMARQVADIYLAEYIKPEEKEAESEKDKRVFVDPAILKKYIGTYQLRPGWLLTITLENDTLMTQATRESKFKTTPRSETSFLVEANGAAIDFIEGENGAVNQLKYREILANRVELFTPSPDQLKEFTGDFYSEELGTTYTIVFQDSQLVAQHRRHDDFPLHPLVVDQFGSRRWWFRAADFQRDNSGQITGFKLTGGRVRNLRFERSDND